MSILFTGRPAGRRDGGRRAHRCALEVGALEGRLLLASPDMTAPTTVATVVGHLGQNGFYTSPVQVDLTATDPDDASSTLRTEFSVNGGAFQMGNVIALRRNGIDTLMYRSVDPAGNVEATHTLVVKIDHTPPVITSLTASPTSLWPPNGRMVPVLITGTVTDNLSGVGPTVGFHVHDEEGVINTTGMAPVHDGAFSFTVMLQASRLGQDKDGRQYTIFVVAHDLAGNTSTRTVVVTVPHDQGHGNSGANGNDNEQGDNNDQGDNNQGDDNSQGQGHGKGKGHGHSGD
jgi:hypothetical protein